MNIPAETWLRIGEGVYIFLLLWGLSKIIQAILSNVVQVGGWWRPK